MNANLMRLKKFVIFIILTSTAWFSSMAVATPLTFNLDGVITDANNQPLEASAVTFRVEIKNPAEDCLLYREDFLVSMTGSKGYFSIVVGKTANLISGGVSLEKVFSNHATAVAGESCSYTPATASETRKVIVSFNDGTSSQVFSTQEIQSVPFAIQAQAVNGYGTGELLKVAPSVSQSTNSNSDLNQAQYDEFWRLVKNPLASYLPVTGDVSVVSGANKVTTLLGQALPAGPASSGQALVSNGTTWTLQSMGAGSVVSVTGTAPVVVGGTATAPVVSLPAATSTVSGHLTSNDWNSFNSKLSPSLASGKILAGNASGVATEVALSGDATLDNSGVMTLKNTGTAGTYGSASLVPIVTTDAQGRVTGVTTAAPLDATKLPLTGGTMSGALTMGAQNITNTGNITMAANKTLGLSSNAADPGSPAAGQVWYNSTSNVIKYYDGSAIQSLGAAGAGLNLTNLTAGKVWIGNASNSAVEQTLSGDIAVSISGGVTVDKTQTAVASKILQLDASSVAATKGIDIGGAGSGKISLRYPNTATNTTLTFPDSAGSANQFLQTDGTGNLLWANPPAATLPGLASTQLWVGNASGGAAAVALSGDIAGITNSGVITANKTTTAQSNKLLSLDGSGVATSMGHQLMGLTSGSLTLQPAAVTTNYALTFPSSQGAAGQTLSNNGAGFLSWASPSDATKLPLGGGQMTGAIDMNSNDINNTGNIAMGANKYLTLSSYPGGSGTAAGQIWYDAGLIKYYNGTTVQSLGVAGAGITSLNGLTSPAQTFVIGDSGTTPAFNSSAAIHTLNIPMASVTSVTAGLISKADYDTFNNKLGTNLTSGQIWVGNGSNNATPVTPGGVLSMSNTGAFSLANNSVTDAHIASVTSPGKVAISTVSTGSGLSIAGVTGSASTKGISITGVTNGVGLNIAASSLGTGIKATSTSATSDTVELSNTGGGTALWVSSGNTSVQTLSASQFQSSGTGSASAPMYTMAGSTNQGMFFPAANVVAFSTASTQRLTIDSNGNVGIGTTSPAAALDVKGTLRLSGASGGFVGFVSPTSGGNTTYTLPFTSGTAGQFLSTDGGGTTATLSWATPSTALPGLASNQVWVGNASGGATAVALTGDIASITSAGTVTVNKTTTAQPNTLLSLDGSGVATASGIALVNLGTVTLSAQTSSSTYGLKWPGIAPAAGQSLLSDSSGNLSWVTPLSASTVFVNGGNTFAGNSSIGNNDNFNLDFKTNATTRMTILNNGNVGIGTPTPSYPLDVSGGSTTRAANFTNTSGLPTASFINNGSGTAALFVSGGSGPAATFSGHLVSAGSLPTLGSCGSGPTLGSGSTDTRGMITTGNSAGTCSMTFSTSYTAAPYCVVSWAGATNLATGIGVTTTTTTLSVHFSAGVSSASFNYYCMQ